MLDARLSQCLIDSVGVLYVLGLDGVEGISKRRGQRVGFVLAEFARDGIIHRRSRFGCYNAVDVYDGVQLGAALPFQSFPDAVADAGEEVHCGIVEVPYLNGKGER